jgi:hypothetical protein
MKILLITGIWTFVGICIHIMKKMQPDDKIYPIWAAFWGVFMTTAVVLYEFH